MGSDTKAGSVRTAARVVSALVWLITAGAAVLATLAILFGFMFLLTMSFDDPASDPANTMTLLQHAFFILTFLVSFIATGSAGATFYYFVGAYAALVVSAAVIAIQMSKQHFLFALNLGLATLLVVAVIVVLFLVKAYAPQQSCLSAPCNFQANSMQPISAPANFVK